MTDPVTSRPDPCLGGCGRTTERRGGWCPRCVAARARARPRAVQSQRNDSAERFVATMEPLTEYDPQSECSHPGLLGARWCMVCGRAVKR